jgi:hypothetical protein
VVSEPVLIMGFNRPQDLKKLVDQLRIVQPKNLYVALDGPRVGHPDDERKVAECRSIIDQIDWPAHIRQLYREENLGCGRAVSEAITWFLDDAGRGIILEDDIIPQESFFPFCTELLDRYQDNPRVLGISGCNFVPPEYLSKRLPYRFSQVPHIWGWATWKRAWEIHDLDISDWRQQMSQRQLWRATGGKLGSYIYWRTIFDLMAQHSIDTWDMQLVFHAMSRGMLTATSNVNLVDNIGWGESATHTERRPAYLRPSQEIDFPLADVPVEVDQRADDWSARVVFEASTLGLIKQGFRHVGRRLNGAQVSARNPS